MRSGICHDIPKYIRICYKILVESPSLHAEVPAEYGLVARFPLAEGTGEIMVLDLTTFNSAPGTCCGSGRSGGNVYPIILHNPFQ